MSHAGPVMPTRFAARSRAPYCCVSRPGLLEGEPVLDRIYTALAETLKSLRYFQNHPNPHTTPPEAEPPDPLVGFQLDYEAFLMVSDALSDELPGLRSYRTEPTVLARYLPFGRVDATRDGFDVMNDARRVIDRHDATLGPEGALRIGVTDTWLEHLLFAAPSGVGGSLFGQLDNDSAAPPLVVRDAADPRRKNCDPATRRVTARGTVRRQRAIGAAITGGKRLLGVVADIQVAVG